MQNIKTPRPNLYDRLKIVALITMIIDHTGFSFFSGEPLWKIVGRTAFPLFLFLVGYNHSFRWRTNLWLRGVGLQIALWLASRRGFIDLWDLNILLVIAGTRVLLQRLQTKNNLFLEIVVFGLSLVLVGWTYPYLEYGTLAVSFALVGYRARKYGTTSIILGSIAAIIAYHIYVMHTIAGYEITPVLILIGLLLLVGLSWITRENTSLRTHISRLDRGLIWISSQALVLYVIHLALLSAIYLLLF